MKQAQAAVEFLITYGWAILGVIIAIGALSYFGVFNTQQYVNEYCNFGNQFKCEDYIIRQNGSVMIELRNNFAANINVSRAVLTVDGIDYNHTRVRSGACASSSCDVTQGSKVIIEFSARPVSLHESVRLNAKITFQKSGAGNPSHVQSGEIYAIVQP